MGIAHQRRSTGLLDGLPHSSSKLKEQGGCSRHPSPSHRNRSTGGSFVKDRDELEVVWWTGWPETAPTNRSTRQPPALDQAALLNSTFGSDGDGRREQGFTTRGGPGSILNRAFRGLDIGANYTLPPGQPAPPPGSGRRGQGELRQAGVRVEEGGWVEQVGNHI